MRQYTNSLPWLLFGMTEEQESNAQGDKRSDGRSFHTVEGYAQHSQCAVFLAKELLLNQQRLDAEDTISYAIDQLQVFEMPDLLCVDTTD